MALRSAIVGLGRLGRAPLRVGAGHDDESGHTHRLAGLVGLPGLLSARGG